MKEINHLRETVEMQLLGRLYERGKDYMEIHFFSFEDGMDPKVCDVLNEKLKYVVNQCNMRLHEYEEKVN